MVPGICLEVASAQVIPPTRYSRSVTPAPWRCPHGTAHAPCGVIRSKRVCVVKGKGAAGALRPQSVHQDGCERSARSGALPKTLPLLLSSPFSPSRVQIPFVHLYALHSSFPCTNLLNHGWNRRFRQGLYKDSLSEVALPVQTRFVHDHYRPYGNPLQPASSDAFSTHPPDAFAANRPNRPFRLPMRHGFRPNRPFPGTRQHGKRSTRHFCRKCIRQGNGSQGNGSQLRTDYHLFVRNGNPSAPCGDISGLICGRRRTAAPRW